MSNSGGKSGSTEGLNIMKKLLKTGNLKRGGNKGSSLNAGAIEHPGDIAAGGATGRTLDRIISAKEDVSKRENYKTLLFASFGHFPQPSTSPAADLLFFS